MSERDKWQISIKDCLTDGIVKEIYNNDKFSICNLADTCYGIFEYELSNKMSAPAAFAVSAQLLEKFIVEPHAFDAWVYLIPDDQLSQNMISFNERIKDILKLKKQKADLEGPLISLEYEQYLIDTYGQQKNR